MNAHFRITNQRTQSTNGKFLMLRNREICPHSGFGHNEMASHLLTHNPPARFLKGLNGFLAGNICEPRHLQGDYDFRLASVGGQSGHRFLIFGPQPGNYRLLDIGQSFFLVQIAASFPMQQKESFQTEAAAIAQQLVTCHQEHS